MGKKTNKRNLLAGFDIDIDDASMGAGASGSGKRHKTSSDSHATYPKITPLRTVRYDQMPENHKRKFYIFNDCGSDMKYVEVLCWLRDMGCADGSGFLGIGNLNVLEETYPLVEVEVVTPQGNSSKFVIAKSVLYLIAFMARNGFFQFCKCGFDVLEFTMLGESYDGKYTGKPWKEFGPKAMIDAINLLATKDLVDTDDATPFVQAAEVFFVHLSEAARLYPVQSLVSRSLQHSAIDSDWKPPHEDEALHLHEASGRGGMVSNSEDICSLTRVDGFPDVGVVVESPDFIEDLIKNFSNLSKAWIVYALTNRRVFDMSKDHVSKYHMRSIKSLRCTLAVLCNINLEKVIKEWQKKIGKHPTFTSQDFKDMEARIRKLQMEKKVLVKD